MNKLNLKVGDKVLLTNGYAYNLTQRISTVTKVTPKGNYRVETSSYLYDCFGFAKGTGAWDAHSSIEPLTDELLASFINKIKKKKCKSLINKVIREDIKLTPEQADEIICILTKQESEAE